MPQGPRSIEPACRDCWGDAARQSDLFGDAASDLVRMPISGCSAAWDLAKCTDSATLQYRGGGPQSLPPRDPIYPCCVLN